MLKLFKQFSIFGAIGFAGIFVNMGLYTVFILTFLKGHELISNILATFLTILFNWILNRILTFKSSKHPVTEAIQFLLVSAIALPLNAVALWFMRDIIHLNNIYADNASIILGTAVGMIVKFVLYKVWVFKHKPLSD